MAPTAVSRPGSISCRRPLRPPGAGGVRSDARCPLPSLRNPDGLPAMHGRKGRGQGRKEPGTVPLGQGAISVGTPRRSSTQKKK